MGDRRQHLAGHKAIKAIRGRPFSAAYPHPLPWDISGTDTKRALRRSFYCIIFFVKNLRGLAVRTGGLHSRPFLDEQLAAGAAKNKNNEPYIVQFVVNRASNEVMSVDVLYAINAKTEPAGSLSPEITGVPATLTGSDISIADLLTYVNRYFPDVLPEGVLRHFGHSGRPAGKLGEGALFSLKAYSEAEKKDHVKSAKEFFGKTYNWNETGYITVLGGPFRKRQKRGGIAPLLSSVIVRDGAEAAASAECRILPRRLARRHPVCYNSAITDRQGGTGCGRRLFSADKSAF